MHKIVALYKFCDIEDPIRLQIELKKEPNNFDLINNLGYTYLLNAEIDKSIKFLSKALELNSNSSYTYANLGTSFFLKNDILSSILKEIKEVK